MFDEEGNPQIIQRKGGGLYHITRPGNVGTVKRYYAEGEQIGMQVNGDMYYTPVDPTGSSLLVLDEAGEEVGQMMYDPYGGILANSFDETSLLNGVLTGPGVPSDPDAGLVHVGDGRWYDPALGRSLQPNGAGGPLLVPQALNRYAATGVGQPGVAAAVASSGCFSSFLCSAGVDVVVDTGALVTGMGSGVAHRIHGAGRSSHLFAFGKPKGVGAVTLGIFFDEGEAQAILKNKVSGVIQSRNLRVVNGRIQSDGLHGNPA